MSPSARDSLFFAAVFALVAWTALVDGEVAPRTEPQSAAGRGLTTRVDRPRHEGYRGPVAFDPDAGSVSSRSSQISRSRLRRRLVTKSVSQSMPACSNSATTT
jgi:hypothetical protein